jgi:hypothetical protein
MYGSGKLRTVETIMGQGGIMENDRRGEFNSDIELL